VAFFCRFRFVHARLQRDGPMITKSPNPSVKFVPAFGLHGTRRKRRAPYLER
jgi:hypothetical protein